MGEKQKLNQPFLPFLAQIKNDKLKIKNYCGRLPPERRAGLIVCFFCPFNLLPNPLLSPQH